MPTNTKKIKVLLYGSIFHCAYRSQSLVRFLLESKYYVSLICPDFYTIEGTKFDLIKKASIGFHLVELFINAAFADVIYLLPLNLNLIRNAIWVSNIFNKKLVVEVYVSMYDTLVKDRKVYEKGSKEAKEAMYKDVLALTQPDCIINLSNHEPAYWAKNLGINLDEDKVFVAPIFSSSTSSTLVVKRRFMQDGTLRICWWGTFIPLHGLDNILQAMQLLKEKGIRFTCNLFGVDNPLFSIYSEKIQLDKLDSHVFLRKDLRFFDNSLPQYLTQSCDLALGIFGDTDKAHHAIPNKLIEALSIGIPTLTMHSPALTEFFNLEKDLWTCEPLPTSMAEKIMEIISGVAYCVNWEQTRQKVLSTFSVTQYQTVISRVLDRIADDL